MKIIKCILLAGCFTGSTVAAAADTLSFRLNWYIVGLHAPFLYGKELGFYKDEGIGLTINEGRGSVNTVQVVAAGSDTFGLADSSSLIAAAAKGAVVAQIVPDGPAAKSGLKKDDVIVSMNGKEIDGRSLRLAVGSMAPGTTIDLKVLRGAGEQKYSITLDTMPADPQGAEQSAPLGKAVIGVERARAKHLIGFHDRVRYLIVIDPCHFCANGYRQFLGSIHELFDVDFYILSPNGYRDQQTAQGQHLQELFHMSASLK